MLKKIICTHGGGRFGNQLINYIHLVALGLEFPSICIEQWELEKYISVKNGRYIFENGVLLELNKTDIDKVGLLGSLPRIATFISFVIAIFLVDFFFDKFKSNGWMMIRSLFNFYTIKIKDVK